MKLVTLPKYHNLGWLGDRKKDAVNNIFSRLSAC